MDSHQDQPPRLLDIHLGRFLAGRSGLTGRERARFEEIVRRVSADLAAGHSCLAVTEEERALLVRSPLVSADGATPLILDEDRLYLQRYFLYESRLARQLCHFAGRLHRLADGAQLLEQCFGPDDEEVDYQKRAASVALHRSLAIISGGPGTGKTTTVVRIIGLLLQTLGPELRVALAAPTGKAANRLMESIGDSLPALGFPREIIASIPAHASTLHRLLGVQRHRPEFRHNHANPLPYDVVVVDEASMVDLALMSKLVDALSPDCRLILLGDKDQLVSVESGAVLADCIASLPDNTVELKKSYRFERGIRSLAEAINGGDGEEAWRLLTADDPPNVTLLRNSYLSRVAECYGMFMERALCCQPHEMESLFRYFAKFRVLCATRSGPRGVDGVNRAVEHILKQRGYDLSSPWYVGRPVLVTANDYSLELFNGDIGICLPDPADGRIKVWFEQPGGPPRSIIPNRLPRCETVWAMTIHKSQGSEFGEVMVLLPEVENRLLSRQLVYTAVTRAKEYVQVVASKIIFVYALQSDYPRSSGLARMLERQGRDDLRD